MAGKSKINGKINEEDELALVIEKVQKIIGDSSDEKFKEERQELIGLLDQIKKLLVDIFPEELDDSDD